MFELFSNEILNQSGMDVNTHLSIEIDLIVDSVIKIL